MSLRYKVLLVLTAVVLAYVSADGTIQRLLVSRSFEELELAEAQKDLARAIDALQLEQEALAAQCRRFAQDERVWSFAGDPGGAAAIDFDETTLAESDLDLLFVVDAGGKVLWSGIRDPESGQPIRVRQFPTESLSRANPFVKPRPEGMAEALAAERGLGRARAGLVTTEHGPMIAASHRILPRDGAGEGRGWVVQGRFLRGDRTVELGRRTHVDFEVYTIDAALSGGPGVPERLPGLLDAITPSPVPVADEVDDDRLDMYAVVSDVEGNPEMIVRAQVDRTISRQGERSVQSALLSSVATAILILLVLLRVLQTMVIKPLSQLTGTAVEIGKTDDVSLRIGMERNDEIGLLSGEFDGMMAKLERSRAELVETARLAGMSEIATGVLHNVGNVLNSVNVSTTLVANQVESFSVEDLEQMLVVLEQNEQDLGRFVSEDPRGKHFLPFLRELQQELHQQKLSIKSELGSLTDGIRHIIDLVRSQQSYAGRAGVQEPVALSAQLEAAFSITAESYAPEARIDLVRDFEELPKVSLDRQKLLEILVNLVRNARQSLAECDRPEKRIVLRCKRSGDGRVRLEVEDNGVGIAEEDLTRLFHSGFTTKPDGHGFGLHISANAATEMGGRLWAESPGPGKGATFIIELPLADIRREAA